MDHATIREQAQSEVHKLGFCEVEFCGFDKYTREDTDDLLGKTWTNIATIHVSDVARVSDVQDALDALSEAGYIPVLDTTDENRVVIEVSITHDVFERLQAEIEGDAQ